MSSEPKKIKKQQSTCSNVCKAIAESKPGLMAQLAWSGYLYELKQNPVATKVITAAILSGFGNIIAQKWVEKKKIDFLRVFKFALISGAIAPISHYWFNMLDKYFRGMKNVAKRSLAQLAVNQLVFSPIVTAVFYALLAIVNGEAGKIQEMIRDNWWSTLKSSWKVWPAADFINFLWVPPELRVLFGNIVGIFWGIILSVISGQK